MSYEIAVCWSILRSLIAGVSCLWLGKKIAISCQRSAVSHPAALHFQTDATDVLVSSRWPVPTSLVLIPFFVPGLVVGYAYRNAALSLVQMPLLNEVLYLAIQVAHVTPVVVLALRWLPAAEMSSTGQFLLHHIHSEITSRRRWGGLLAGDFPRHVTAFVIAALLCFQEVEIATLMQARGWPEWIFTRQAGGVELSEVWPYLVLPAGYGLALIVPVLGYWAFRVSDGHDGFGSQVSMRNTESGGVGSSTRLAWIVVTISWMLVVIWPVTSLLIGAFRGRETIHLRTPIWREIGDALIQAGTVTLLVWGGIGMVKSRGGQVARAIVFSDSQRSTLNPRRLLILPMLIPGLLGSLALGLAVFEICQRIGVSPSYSPVPLVAAMALFFLPRALTMRAMLWRSEGQSNLFLARTMGKIEGRRDAIAGCQSPNAKATESGHSPSPLEISWGLTPSHSPDSPQGIAHNPLRWSHRIIWHLQGAGRFWAVALLFWWSYLELTLPSLLRPAGMAPAPMRLYNFLHYGHIPGLAAMLVVVLGVPVLGGSLCLVCYRRIVRV